MHKRLLQETLATPMESAPWVITHLETRQEPGLRASFIAEGGSRPTGTVLQPLLQSQWYNIIRHGTK
jgi:hypothetical protein